ncbi:leucine-rich repeat-containing protein 47-like [Belonocnema kinseyi]|uniref:leucine-rich repeat-containing protein 47-like n=1 Tax=Belonocnema kinseyi TaxID=2817044 RepID=UPI00143D39F9|nr:leucine-rich repeat-containing protein 47-like [Belonocnema kinseyi]XP_033217798.1 leucine-rich repeat-containing protein 47-like [Belonocnema kinseyi]
MLTEDTWNEVIVAVKENRHELILSGPTISKKISSSGIDPALFNLQNLNFLNIHQTGLQVIPEEIGKLVNLTSLVLHSNNLEKLPSSIKNLTKLKVLDCSRNKLSHLPQEISRMPQLATVNLGSNLLTDLPSQASNLKLALLDLSNNKFDHFPDVCYAELVHLAEIRVNGNLIKEIPANINVLGSLKLLDLADNKIAVVPGELADCTKLKDLNLKGNSLSDKRLLKLVDQCRTKQVLDYVRQHCARSDGDSGGGAGNKSKKGKKSNKSSENENIANIEKLTHELKVLKVTDEAPKIAITEQVKAVRPHIIACIVRNMTFTEESFKKFIQLQTKLHEGICEKRQVATLATHDLNLLVSGNITYTAMPPQEIQIKPLNRTKNYSGAALFRKLQTEAENLRKEKKRNAYSGIHKYLYLIEGKPLFPCLLDNEMQVISFPPITNSDITKMSASTKNMLVEVTSATSQQICRQVMDQFLKELVTLGLGCSLDSSDSEEFHKLIVEQVKVVDMEGNMKQVYPCRTDLNFEDNSIAINRE